MIINWKETIRADKGYDFYNGGWAKEVTRVDRSVSNGYAFEGDFVNPKDGLSECGDGYYIVCSLEGSRKHPVKRVAVYEIKGDELTKAIDWVEGNDWALQIRDRLAGMMDRPTADQVEAKPSENPLAGYSAEELLEELKRRGVSVE